MTRNFGKYLHCVLNILVSIGMQIQSIMSHSDLDTVPLLFIFHWQAANSNVRQNALHLLLDMFPLEDPDATKDVKDTVLHKQFFLLERLLVDDCPDVRVVAVEGCFRILRLFWEVIPPSTISKMLAKLVDDMQYDSCTEVRLSTLNGVIYLLGNPQTHELLKVLLPRFGKMFVDPVLSIRVAVADLLLAVRDIRTFQFNKVCSCFNLALLSIWCFFMCWMDL